MSKTARVCAPATHRLSRWLGVGPWLRQLVLLGLMAGGGAAQAQLQPSSSALDAPLFYQLLLAELQARQGDPGAGYSLMLDAARRQQDPQLYRRAVEIALGARAGEAALTAARAWSQADRASPEPERYVLQILLALNRVEDTAPVLRALVQRLPAAERLEAFPAIVQTYARVTDRAKATAAVRQALAPWLNEPAYAAAAWATLGRMELTNQQPQLALEAAQRGHRADPGAPLPALLALELMQRGLEQAEAVVQAHLRLADAAREPTVAMAYARVLLDLDRPNEARNLLLGISRQHPQMAETWLLLGGLQMQDGKADEATASVERFLSLARETGQPTRGLTQAYLILAQAAEQRRDFAAANAWLDRIENAEEVLAAQARRASLLAHQKRMPEARALLRAQPERRPEDARLKLAAEARLLRDFKAWEEAYGVYQEAMTRFPDDPDWWYEAAMMAEKAGRLEDMERLLRRLIDARPEDPHAYNALGYALADRNIRLDEARRLIEKAVALAPQDAYIKDSLGWVAFRQGNLAEALRVLEAAYRLKPDAEIAAHLGEVLWTSGQRDRALTIWREGLLLASDNETLLETLRRFQVKP